MTTRLSVICHAATAATRAARFPRDEPLDARGEAGAAALARQPALARMAARADRLLTAPTVPSRQTAGAFGLPFADDDGLRDLDVGGWAGRGVAELAVAEPEALAGWTVDPAAAPPGGESLQDLLARMSRWMDDQARRGGRVLAVAQPAVLRAACTAALAAGPASFWRIEAPPLAVATLSHDGRRWALAGLGASAPPAD